MANWTRRKQKLHEVRDAIKTWFRMRYLIAKGKVSKWTKWKPINFIITIAADQDLTPVFVFLGLHLLGYEWTLKTLLASIGAWVVFKEAMKHFRLSLSAITVFK